MEQGFRIESAAISDRGLSEKRPQNEDSFLEIAKKGIFAVADGVGGAQAGEVASQMAVEILGEAFANAPVGSDAEQLMHTALVQANTAIYQMSNDLAQLAKMATTVVALHVHGNIATIGHVGDSRLYRLDSSGSLHRETADHSMVGEEVRAGRMTEEQAENHPSKNIISRALGAEMTVDVDLKTIMLDSDSTFLLCSDGVTRHIGDIELGGLLASPHDTSSICKQIKNICYERGAEDNLTAVIVKLTTTGNSASVSHSVFDPRADVLAVPDYEDVTIATPRYSASPDDDLLELDTLEIKTAELTVPDEDAYSPLAEPEQLVEVLDGSTDAAVDASNTEPIHNAIPEKEPAPEPIQEPIVSNDYIVEQQNTLEPSRETTFPMFGESADVPRDDQRGSQFGKLLSYLGMLLIGGLMGLGIYHFALKPTPATGPSGISEMRAANIPLSAFEENRREVDKDPVGYLTKNTTPQDAEDYYLVGRAHMLTGAYTQARAAFTESRNRIAEADQINAKVLSADIAMALAVTNDTTIQSMLKKELDAARPIANSNSIPIR